MLPQEVIRRKRDGAELTSDEIAFIVRGIADGSLSEGQVAAFAMAVFFRGMSMAERVALTHGMARSGRVLSWHDLELPGPVLDKHSTGGVGDKVSLVLAPIVAACGGFVPMISGRGLGHTGGTLDKLESIPGYRANPDIDLFRRVVREAGCAIIGQTDDLAPADRRLYATRDVTATVESIPLLTSSILSKKLAAGLDGLVMDVKTGSGAFIAEASMARELAESIVAVANGAGLPTTALMTDMDEVLGRNAGNALEVAEVVSFLADGRSRDARLHEVVVALGAEILALGGLARNVAEGRRQAEVALADGRAAEIFARMVAGLGGPTDFIDRTDAHLAKAPVERACTAREAGFVVAMDARAVGMTIVALGGGRRKVSDRIDPSVGVALMCRIGAAVSAGEPLAIVHAATNAAAEAAIASLHAAIRIAPVEPEARPTILARITANDLGPPHRTEAVA